MQDVKSTRKSLHSLQLCHASKKFECSHPRAAHKMRFTEWLHRCQLAALKKEQKSNASAGLTSKREENTITKQKSVRAPVVPQRSSHVAAVAFSPNTAAVRLGPKSRIKFRTVPPLPPGQPSPSANLSWSLSSSRSRHACWLFLRSTGATAMSESMEEDHSIQASEQDDYQEQIKEYELEQAMLEAEFVMHEMAKWESDPIEKAIMMQDAQDQRMFQQEMELEKRMAKMQVQYRNMDGQMLHCSRPCPIVPERFGSYREAELAELHARNNNESDVTLSLQELRSRRKRAGKPTPAQFLENRPPREVLLHDLDASHVGPICLETTKLVCGSDLMTLGLGSTC